MDILYSLKRTMKEYNLTYSSIVSVRYSNKRDITMVSFDRTVDNGYNIVGFKYLDIPVIGDCSDLIEEEVFKYTSKLGQLL